MTPEQWKLIKHFHPGENWGDPTKIEFDLVLELDRFRDFVDTPIHINFGTNGAHISESQHALGLAVDIMFPEKKRRDLFGLALSAMRFKFMGIGIYPHWLLGQELIGGLHLDVRRSADFKALWMGVRDEDLSQKYIPMSTDNLKAYGLI